MITADRINAVAGKIVEAYHPERVILFGSYAYGTPRDDSDVDMLVVLPFEGKGAVKAAEILQTIDPEFALDLVVRTPEQVARRISLNDFFLREVVTRGKVLHAAPH